MKKGHFKLQASSSRAVSVGFGGFGSVASGSPLSYYTEPPDLSTIGNPYVVVAFKTLSKRDENTRLKALQDLRVHINSLAKERDEVEDSVIEAWINVYPRLSIDSSRMVRDLSHSIQYDLLSTSQKRLSMRVSKFVGSWLAGQFDRDRTVASNVRKAIRSLLPTDVKLISFYTRHQAAALNYAHDAIQETPETLSDERTMSKADMQAKYFVVIGSSISLVLELLQKLDTPERSKLQNDYTQFFSAKKLWKLVSCEDSGIRQIICELVIQCCDKQRNIISENLDILRKAFIAEGLLEPQQGSASKILDALRALTIKFPGIWELHHKSTVSRKVSTKHPLTELNIFILAGPRLEAVNFWNSLSNLLKVLPVSILPKKTEDSIKFLHNLQASFSVRAGMKLAAKNAWYCYVDVFELLVGNLADGESKSSLLRSTMFPLFSKYLGNILASDQASDNIHNTQTAEIEIEVALRVYKVCSRHGENDSALNDEWENLGDEIIKKTKLSISEQTTSGSSSQDTVSKLSKLWFSLLAEVHRSYNGEGDSGFHQEPLFVKSIDIIKAAYFMICREGKPFCAARILENAITLTPDLFTSSPDRLIFVHDIFTIHFPKLLYSPSAVIIVPIMFQLPSLPGLEGQFESIWHKAVGTFLSTHRSKPIEVWIETAENLISSKAIASIAQNHQKLQNFLLEEINYFILEEHPSRSIIHAAFKFGVLSQSSALVVIDSLIEYLNGSYDFQRVFYVLDLLNKHMHHLMDFKFNTHVDLVLKLFAVEENALMEQGFDSEIVKKSRELRGAIMSENPIDSMSKIVSVDLKKSGKSSNDLFLAHLIEEVKKLFHERNSSKQLELLLPSTEDWSKYLNHLLDQPLRAALAVTPEFGSVIYLINRNLKPVDLMAAPLFDTHGFTMPIRKAIYTSEFLFDWDYGSFSIHSRLKLLELTLLTLEIAESDVKLLQSSFLFDLSLSPNDKDILMHFIQNTPLQLQAFANDSRISPEGLNQDLKENVSETASQVRINKNGTNTLLLWDLIHEYLKTCELQNPVSFYAGKALTRVLKILVKESKNESDLIENWVSNILIIKSSTHNIIGASAVLAGLGTRGKSSNTVKNLCNHLISDLLGLSIDSDKLIDKLILLNSCLAIYDGENLPIAQNRIVFSVKHIITWTEVVEDPCLVLEICRLLQRLLPSIKDIYGSFWEACIRFCSFIWTKQKDRPLHDENLAVILTSLELYSSLNEFEDPNDDLSEALVELEEQTASNLLELLFVERHVDHKPLERVDEKLAKLIISISPNKIESIDKYYPLLASDFFWIQSAAYILIQKSLPALQQQLSVEILLENKDASLSDELLSLIIAQPSNLNINYSDELFQSVSSEYLEVRRYLLAWLLVFEIFAASSYKVRSDLNNFLKSHNSIEPLVSLIFQILGHLDEKPLDLKKENISAGEIRKYDLINSIKNSNRQNDLVWILVNLYFQLLNYAPSVVKGWWLDTKKQIKNIICSWTERFISPILVEEELIAVRSWAESQDSLDEDQNLVIKVAKNVREISVGYEIDDMVMRFLIHVPKNYPLDLVRVESINRVGISEQKWNSFLMTTNGVINFSNGSISDSLYIFRKNIISALKGQVECAICYSIISANRKLPDKTCGTCNNIFHSKCLFQWFKSSSQSNCPLCRTTFKY